VHEKAAEPLLMELANLTAQLFGVEFVVPRPERRSPEPCPFANLSDNSEMFVANSIGEEVSGNGSDFAKVLRRLRHPAKRI
jgi:hypothetical protein